MTELDVSTIDLGSMWEVRLFGKPLAIEGSHKSLRDRADVEGQRLRLALEDACAEKTSRSVSKSALSLQRHQSAKSLDCRGCMLLRSTCLRRH